MQRWARSAGAERQDEKVSRERMPSSGFSIEPVPTIHHSRLFYSAARRDFDESPRAAFFVLQTSKFMC